MRYLVIGGTGTLGQAVISRLYNSGEIHVFSREELKQKQLKSKFPLVKCYLGDVANRDAVMRVFDLVRPDVVFHLAALKHVEIAEENPEYCMAVNYFGTQNVAEAARHYMASYVVFSSTDKAVLPINTYGASKLAAENLLFDYNQRDPAPKFSVYRWGNVCGSRGSVIHAFVDSLLTERRVYITDFSMTRFWIHIEDVAAFMVGTYSQALKDRAMIPEMKASKVIDLAVAVADHLEIKDFEIVETGIRRGEKFAECLWSEHDHCLRSDTCPQYSQDELRALVKRVLA